MKIKLCAFDVDGTLLNSKQELLPEVISEIKRVKEKGIAIVLCTGRPFIAVKEIIEKIGLSNSDYIVNYNGSIIRSADGNILRKEILTYEDFVDIEAMSRRVFIPVHALVGNPERIMCLNRNINEYSVYESNIENIPLCYCTPEDIGPDNEIIKMMYIAKKNELDRAIGELPDYFFRDYNCVKSAEFFFEMMNKNSSKGNALDYLCQFLKIPAEEVLAIGDHENDLSMIEYAGLGIAMGNATSQVKKVANFVTGGHDEAGVALALEKLIL